MKLKELKAYQILDSRGNPTIGINAVGESKTVSFAVPSGASTGKHEAIELRDGGKEYHGLGVSKAVDNVNKTILKAVAGFVLTDQKKLDQTLLELDGTENKAKLGANAILAVSGVFARLAASELGIPLFQYLKVLSDNDGQYQADGEKKQNFLLPKMFFNIINGGEHADNRLDFQETMIVPQRESVAENLRLASEVYHTLKKNLKTIGLSTGLGDEGGFAPDLESNSKALELITEAIAESGYQPGKDIAIALDVAANSLVESEVVGQYRLASEGISLSAVQLVSYYKDLLSTFPIISIEDGLSEDDWSGWQMMTERLADQVQLVGDDIFVTNPRLIEKGIKEKVANSVLIKINQIGTISETLTAVRLAHQASYRTFISHRSGETSDDFIADLVVAVGAGQIKAGAPARGERTAKYNRLLQIERELK